MFTARNTDWLTSGMLDIILFYFYILFLFYYIRYRIILILHRFSFIISFTIQCLLLLPFFNIT